jgi:hypothetical protein
MAQQVFRRAERFDRLSVGSLFAHNRNFPYRRKKTTKKRIKT